MYHFWKIIGTIHMLFDTVQHYIKAYKEKGENRMYDAHVYNIFEN